MEPPCDKIAKPHKGVRADRWWVGVVYRGRGSGPISQDVLPCSYLESFVGGNDRRNRREVVPQVERDGK